jgi:hypothetical protein
MARQLLTDKKPFRNADIGVKEPNSVALDARRNVYMSMRQPKLPIGGGTTTGAGDDEREAIRILCSRSTLYCWCSTLVPSITARLTGYRGGFQNYRDWSEAFSNHLLAAEHQEQRRNFLQLRESRRLRSGAVLFSLYLFAQQIKTEQYSEAHFGEEVDAAKRLNALIEAFDRDISPHLAILEKAPGMWPGEAKSIRQSIRKIKERVRTPGTKRNRNKLHRNASHTLLRLGVYMCGHMDTSRPKQTDLKSRLARRIISAVLGPNPEHDCEQAMSLAQMAAWAIGKWISMDSLTRLYYEKRNPASDDIKRHVDYHLGS